MVLPVPLVVQQNIPLIYIGESQTETLGAQNNPSLVANASTFAIGTPKDPFMQRKLQ